MIYAILFVGIDLFFTDIDRIKKQMLKELESEGQKGFGKSSYSDNSIKI